MDQFLDRLGADMPLPIKIIGGIILFIFVLPIIVHVVGELFWILRKTIWLSRKSYWSSKRLLRHPLRQLWRSLRKQKSKSGGYSSFDQIYGTLHYNAKGRRLTAGASLAGVTFKSTKKYTPWRENYWLAIAFALFGVSVMILSILLCVLKQSYFFLVMGLIAAVSLYWGDDYFVIGLKRKHGKSVELAACNKFKKVYPEEWDVVGSGYIVKVGDVDLLIRLSTDELCVVEIKSWHRWSGLARKSLAISQVYRQLRALNASYPVIWLPHSPTAFVANSRGVFIVGGSAKYLCRQLDTIIQYNAVIRFPAMPPQSVRDFVKSLRFKYNARAAQWHGKCSMREKGYVSERISLSGGLIELDAS